MHGIKRRVSASGSSFIKITRNQRFQLRKTQTADDNLDLKQNILLLVKSDSPDNDQVKFPLCSEHVDKKSEEADAQSVGKDKATVVEENSPL